MSGKEWGQKAWARIVGSGVMNGWGGKSATERIDSIHEEMALFNRDNPLDAPEAQEAADWLRSNTAPAEAISFISVLGYAVTKAIQPVEDPHPEPVAVEKAHKLQGRTDFKGLKISIENKKGSTREWHDPNSGEDGSTTMKHDYGYIRMTEGVDGDHVDVYLGPNEKSDQVFIVHQMAKPDFKEYDEDKVMLGFDSEAEAKAAYIEQYDDARFFGTMTTMDFEEFKIKVLATKDNPAVIKATAIGAGGGKQAPAVLEVDREGVERHHTDYLYAQAEHLSGLWSATFEGTVLQRVLDAAVLDPAIADELLKGNRSQVIIDEQFKKARPVYIASPTGLIGVMRLGPGREITDEEFKSADGKALHKISDEQRQEWWGSNKIFAHKVHGHAAMGSLAPVGRLDPPPAVVRNIELNGVEAIHRNDLARSAAVLVSQAVERGVEIVFQPDLMEAAKLWGAINKALTPIPELDGALKNLPEIVIRESYVAMIGAAIYGGSADVASFSPEHVDLVVSSDDPSDRLEVDVERALRRDTIGKGIQFIYDKFGPAWSHLPLWDLVLRPRTGMKLVQPEGAPEVAVEKDGRNLYYPATAVPPESDGESQVPSVRDVLESRLHEAFTVASDRMLSLGILSRAERTELSGVIGKTLAGFGRSVDGEVAKRAVRLNAALQLVLKSGVQPLVPFAPPAVSLVVDGLDLLWEDWASEAVSEGVSVESEYAGVRIIAHKSERRVTLVNSGGLDRTAILPSLAQAIRELPDTEIILDGTAIWTKDGELVTGEALEALSTGSEPVDSGIQYRISDIAWRNKSLTALSRSDREKHMKEIAQSAIVRPLESSTATTREGIRDAFIEAVRREGAEGAIFKRLDSPYRVGSATMAWAALRLSHVPEFGAMTKGIITSAALADSGKAPAARMNTSFMAYELDRRDTALSHVIEKAEGKGPGPHSHGECMECSSPPEFECVWANGYGRAWHCKAHWEGWITTGDGKGEVVRWRTLFDGRAAVKYGDAPGGISTSLNPVTRIEKSSEGAEDTTYIPVFKSAAEERMVYGIVLEPETYDGHAEIYDEITIRNAAHHYLEFYQQKGVQHGKSSRYAQFPDGLRLLESYIAPVDFMIAGKRVKKGSWIMAMRVDNDALWADIKSGRITGYSVAGIAKAIEMAA